MKRQDKRKLDELRPVKIETNYIKGPAGSAYIQMGDTKVICTCCVEDGVPNFLKNKKSGWITSEYAMLPGCSASRIKREREKVSGRSAEIQRLIGRSLRSVIDLKKIGERTLYLDCDVIQADGGTRTASITGAFVALMEALNCLKKEEKIKIMPITNYVAAVSVGIIEGKPMLDLCYQEDSSAEVDMNIVMTEDGRFIEIQGTAETKPFSQKEMNELLTLAQKGINELIELQKKVLSGEIYGNHTCNK